MRRRTRQGDPRRANAPVDRVSPTPAIWRITGGSESMAGQKAILRAASKVSEDMASPVMAQIIWAAG
jgi:hypothetical protein